MGKKLLLTAGSCICVSVCRVRPGMHAILIKHINMCFAVWFDVKWWSLCIGW